MSSDQLLFYFFAALALGGSLAVVAQRSPVYSVVSLIVAFFGLSGLYILLESPFAAVVQIIIYAGAIMVLFLFVVMLLNAPRENSSDWDRAHPYYRPGPMRLGAVMAVLFGVQIVWALTRTTGIGAGVGDAQPPLESVRDVGRVLFTDYMFAFELTSILIIVAMVGAVVLARRREE